jgi:fumarate reductase subunit C
MARPYPRQRSATWFLARPAYLIFVLRELSAVFLALYVIVLLLLTARVSEGAASFEDFLATLRSPVLIVFHAIALGFALLHSVTWFQAVPKGLPLRRGEDRIPPALLIGLNYAALAAATVMLLAIALW